ncbi:MAG: SHOCT domain-containing protein [Gammaproteobacteria bacterium]|nr:SHOCT domain-containing protein [Gammaproteobacteria bacterium]MCP4089425.1 SHOCT domain-containing protein [Gammaproteobacteria bacterium]MCP4277540.1 SHOCT domain-containing protein [Gammaproteobacteria bacterium]MCP4831148.1 SHOCT domain-containing protein [Gammaproteobacteria bacterium]MCP4928571.1 SHOCT domain-containing protein [Gammaproteobacteria bacterium]
MQFGWIRKNNKDVALRNVDASVITAISTKTSAGEITNLQKLEELHEAGILTDGEFERIKLRIPEE